MSDNPTPRPFACECGREHERCLGHSARTGEPCRLWPINGSDVCRTHGAGAPQVLGAARRRVERANAERAIISFGLPRNVEPHEALREEIARTAGAVDWLGGIVGDLDREQVERGFEEVERSTSRFPGLDGQAGPETLSTRAVRRTSPSVWVELWQRERRHLVEVCKVAIACGLAEREVKLAEEHGRAIADIFRRIEDAAEMAWSAEQLSTFRRLAIRELRTPIPLPAAAAS